MNGNKIYFVFLQNKKNMLEYLSKLIIYFLYIFYNAINIFGKRTKPSLVYFSNSEDLKKSIIYFIPIFLNFEIMYFFGYLYSIIFNIIIVFFILVIFVIKNKINKKRL